MSKRSCQYARQDRSSSPTHFYALVKLHFNTENQKNYIISVSGYRWFIFTHTAFLYTPTKPARAKKCSMGKKDSSVAGRASSVGYRNNTAKIGLRCYDLYFWSNPLTTSLWSITSIGAVDTVCSVPLFSRPRPRLCFQKCFDDIIVYSHYITTIQKTANKSLPEGFLNNGTVNTVSTATIDAILHGLNVSCIN